MTEDHRSPPEPKSDLTRSAIDVCATVSGGEVPVRANPIREVPGYAIERTLGEGAMGIVYKAQHKKLNRVVALKMILAGRAASSKEVLRFLAEAEAVAAIDHPNVVKVYDIGDVEGHPFLAMEYLPGGSLSERLKHEADQRVKRSGEYPALTPLASASLVRKIALGIQVAHNSQIVHRDLKPSNVLFDAHDEPRVTDFGLAKRAGADLTQTNAILGTPAYMAPEQARGGTKFVGPAADVYSLGVILYECLTGHRPFDDPDPLMLIRKVAEDPPSSIRSHVKSLPKDLELVVQKCLSKDPKERYESAEALADDLKRWMGGEPVRAKAASPVERTRKWMKRNKLATGLLAASLFVSIGMTLLARSAARNADVAEEQTRIANIATTDAIEQKNRAESSEKTAQQMLKVNTALLESERKSTQKAKEEAERATRAQQDLSNEKRRIISHKLFQADGLFERRKFEAVDRILRDIPEEHRGFVWHFLNRENDEFDLKLRLNAEATRIVVSPRDLRAAAGDATGTVRVWNLAKGAITLERRLHEKPVVAMAWSQDGVFLATAAEDGTLSVWDTVHDLVRRETVIHRSTAIQSLVWSPDGSRLISCNLDGRLRSFPFALFFTEDEVKTIARNAASPPGTPRVPIAQNWIVTAAAGQVLATEPDLQPERTPMETGRTQPVPVKGAVFNSDGRRIAIHRGTRKIEILDAGSLKSTAITEASATVTHLQWKPQVDEITLAMEDGIVAAWIVKEPQPKPLPGHFGLIAAVTWNPDGRLLAIAGLNGTLAFVDGSTGVTLKQSFHAAANATSLDWSGDGRYFLIVDRQNFVKMCDLAQRAESRECTGHTSEIRSIAWHPLGLRFVSAGWDGNVKIWDSVSGRCERSIAGGAGFIWHVCWSPDGAKLAVACDDGVTRIYNAEDGSKLRELRGHRGPVRILAWSPSGLLASAGWDKSILIWDPANGNRRNTLRGHTDVITALAWQRNQPVLASASHDKTIRIWNANTGESRELTAHADGVSGVAWSGDGNELVSLSRDSTIRIWNPMMSVSRELVKIDITPNSIPVFDWHPNSRMIACVGADNCVTIWDGDTGLPLKQLRKKPGAIHSIAWSPDGLSLACAGADKVVTFWESRKDAGLNAARREAVLAPNASWHREQARSAEDQQQWRAVAFHLRRLIVLEPNDATHAARLAAAEEKLKLK